MRVVRLEQLEQVAWRSCNATSVEVLKVRMDGALNNLVQWEVSLSKVGELELDDL